MKILESGGGGKRYNSVFKPVTTPYSRDNSGYRAPAPQRRRSAPAPTPTRSYSSSRGGGSPNPSGNGRHASNGSSGNSRSGGGLGNTTPAKPKPISAQKYLLGDTTYQSQLSELRQALQQYQATQKNDLSTYQQQYGLNSKTLGEDRTKGYGDLLEDYASRGMAQSGVYGKAYADLQSQYDARQTQLDQSKQGFVGDQATNLANFQGTQNTTKTSAKQEALARRLAAIGG